MHDNVLYQVPKELWSGFLSAVVADDQATLSPTDDLHSSLRSLLRDIRSTLGSAAWTRALQELGPSRARLLRHRYKLY